MVGKTTLLPSLNHYEAPMGDLESLLTIVKALKEPDWTDLPPAERDAVLKKMMARSARVVADHLASTTSAPSWSTAATASTSTLDRAAMDRFYDEYMTKPTGRTWLTAEPGHKMDDKITGSRYSKSWIEDSSMPIDETSWGRLTKMAPKTKPTGWSPTTLTPAEEAERAVRRAEKAAAADMRNTTVAAVGRIRPDLLGRMKGGPSRDAMLEILNRSDFDRAKFGYGRHQQYQAHLESLIDNWTRPDHDNLLAHIDAMPVHEPEPCNDTFGMTEDELRAMRISRATAVPSRHDPKDTVPDDWVEELAAEQAAAERVIW